MPPSPAPEPDASTPRAAIGCMTGTSLDGLDSAAVVASGSGLGLTGVRVIGWDSRPLPERDTLASLAAGESLDAESIARAAAALGEAHADSCQQAWPRHASGSWAHPGLVCVHGQTVFHRPPMSWQLINPWPIARRLGCPVVFDLRGADLVGGGEGAPITPIADWIMFRADHESRAIVNLGGFCNATLLEKEAGIDRVRAFDVCACNQVLDHASRRGIGQLFDPDGSHAMSGTPDPDAVATLEHTLIGGEADADRSDARRSLGTGDECSGWVEAWHGRLSGPDLLASACAGIGRTIARSVGRSHPGSASIVLAGGSAANGALVRAIDRHTDAEVLNISEVPVRGSGGATILADQREAAAFAVLGLLLADGVEITLPGVTGRAGSIPLSGAWIRPHDIPDRRPRPTGGTC